MSHEVHQKWGFGLAPPKPLTQAARANAAAHVVRFLDVEERHVELVAALSEVKGLFSRIARQDQWDWFATSKTLGYPSARVSTVIATSLGSLRRGVTTGDDAAVRNEWLLLRRLPCRPCLRILMGAAQIAEEQGKRGLKAAVRRLALLADQRQLSSSRA